ncbi:aldehyde dehydrogenase family protein [Jatrophihabitans cynanchi]|uniref:Aldehyde dehydrogenase family protein n=1 Tax=Jatrophihabitans cynanchi TaxID=2944128 RepID=A0ABY7K639_9ACTN|nr:aldehyde dehydrogenase family protein [Jatrophihabitans sp. SB3-54]WAX58982.1 aldehyde dehydrogenase family protein [Jatrophihabitans sp. SB3-54]
MAVELARSPYTGAALADYVTTPPAGVNAAVSAATRAAAALADSSPATFARWLDAIADALVAQRDRLAELADSETGLGLTRLSGEVERTANQLRFYGAVAREGSHLGATLDTAPTVIARVQRPLGPVAVFGASNFPFAFGVLGHDTGSAIASGSPVVVKGHPAHPGLSRRLAEIATEALGSAGAPPGTFGLVTGFDAGTALVRHPGITAVAFTGSERGGTALWRIANERAEHGVGVIPVYCEMGTVNAAVVTPGAASLRADSLAVGFVESFTLGMGQFCTKPGLLLAPSGAGLPAAVAAAVADRPAGVLLTEAIAADCRAGVDRLVQNGATVLSTGAGVDNGWSAAVSVLTVPASALTKGSPLLAEVFGPVAMVVEYADRGELETVIAQLPGALAAAVHANDDEDVAALTTALSAKVGRVVFNGWPTGVATTWAQQHGGPWPATTVPSATSVGAAALARFLRPVAFQDVPDTALPPALQASNPWKIPRRIDGAMQ